jgi:hypothetical protein
MKINFLCKILVCRAARQDQKGGKEGSVVGKANVKAAHLPVILNHFGMNALTLKARL